MSDFLSGAIAAAYLVIALFFLKFYRRSQDALFAWFSVAFFVLAAQRVLLFAVGNDLETDVYVYGVRLVAFLMILFAIVQKNARSK